MIDLSRGNYGDSPIKGQSPTDPEQERKEIGTLLLVMFPVIMGLLFLTEAML